MDQAPGLSLQRHRVKCVVRARTSVILIRVKEFSQKGIVDRVKDKNWKVDLFIHKKGWQKAL